MTNLIPTISSPSCSPAVPNLFGTRDRFRGRQFFNGRGGWGRRDGSGGNGSDGERRGAAREALLPRLPLTSCCAAWFLTDRGPLPVRGLGLGDPCCNPYLNEWYHIYLDTAKLQPHCNFFPFTFTSLNLPTLSLKYFLNLFPPLLPTPFL